MVPKCIWPKNLKISTFLTANKYIFCAPIWFQNNEGFSNILIGLRKIGFADYEISKISGENWLRFIDKSFAPSRTELNS